MALTAFTEPDQEAAFQTWYGNHARRFGWPSVPEAVKDYDFRNAFMEGYEPDADGTVDARASALFARGKLKGWTVAPYAATTDTTTTPADDTAPAPQPASSPLSPAQRQDALARLDNIQSRIGILTSALDTYARGYVTPIEAEGYRKLSKSPEDYARRLSAHGHAFKQGVAIGEGQARAFHDTGFLAGLSQKMTLGLAEAGLGAARFLGHTSAMMMPGVPGVPTTEAIDASIADIHAKVETDLFGLPSNPIERAGYDSAFPWVGRLLGDVGAFMTVATATSGLGEAAGIPRMFAAARGARNLVAVNSAGAIGGGLIAAALAPDDEKMTAAVEGAAIGLGGTALLSSFLAGRPIGTSARLLRLQAMGDALAAEGLGGALRVAPRLTFGRMAMSGIEGAGYATLKSMGQGEPVDKAIGIGIEEGLMFAGYDTAFIGLGRAARWLPVQQNIAKTWASTAEALKLPGRMASMFTSAGSAVTQGAPLAMIGELVGGPVGAAIGGTIGAAKAAKLQQELAITAARLRSTGALTEETIGKVLTGSWTKMSAEEAEAVTKALTKDVVERATADLDPVLKYAVNESMGADAILDNTELRALSLERGRVTQSIAMMRGQGILEIDPQMVQASRRLAELAERRNQVLLEEVNSMGSTGAVAEKVVDSWMRDMVETASIPRRMTLTEGPRAGRSVWLRGGATGAIDSGTEAAERLIASVRAAGGGERIVKGVTEAPTRVTFRTNSTILRDLGDAGLERNGIDAALSKEGEKALDALMAPGRRRQLTGRAIEGENVGRPGTPRRVTGLLPGNIAAPAGTKLLKAPRVFNDFDFGDSTGAVGGQLSRALGGGALGGAVGARVDEDHPIRGAVIGAAAGVAGASIGERLLSRVGAARQMVEGGARRVERRAVERTSVPVSEMSSEQRALEDAYSRARASRTKLDPSLARTVQSLKQQGASTAEIEGVIKSHGARPVDYGPLYERGSLDAPSAMSNEARATIDGGYTFTPAGEIARKDKEPIRYFTSNKDMPDGGGRAGSRTTEEVIRRNGLDPFANLRVRPGEIGAARLGILGPLASGGVGALVAPAIARHLDLLDEEDSVLTASAIGFMVAAGLGYKMLARDGARLSTDALRVARFVKPAITDTVIPPADITRVIGKTGEDFRATVNGSQISGRRLYWALPQESQIAHTISTLDAWPQRTTLKGKALDLPERRKLFERDLTRFAPFTVTDTDWGRITEHFMASTKALGYTPVEAMRLYKGWLGWMTTPLEHRARTDISRMSLDRLGRDATNPFTTAAGIDELRTRAVFADTITGPSQPLPRNYRAAANSLNKDGTPTAGRIRDLVDDIEANAPSAAEGTADTITPWWSAPGLRGVAPTVRFYRYAERISAGGDAVGQLIHNVTRGIFEATEFARVADDKDRQVVAAIFRGINSPADMDLVRLAVESTAARDAMRGTNPRIFEAAIGVRKFLIERADAMGLPHMERIEDYFPWVYNFRTKRELAELAKKGIAPTDINYPIDAPVPRHVFFNHLESRSATTPLGQQLSPMESLLLYSHGANRKIYMDQLLANFGPETFGRIRATQPWIAHDLGRWLMDVVGVPGPGTAFVQKKVEQLGLYLEKFPVFQRAGLAQEINERYLLSPGGANNLSRLATGYAYTSKIAWNFLSATTNLSQQIINGGTEYGLLNVLTSSVIGAGIAGAERAPVLAPIFDAITPKGASFRRLLTERGILSETSQRHFDTIALYEAAHGTNRAHLALTGAVAGAAAGAAATALLNTDRAADDQISMTAGAATGASIASIGAAKSAIMRRALMRVRDSGTFAFNLVETWNRATIGVAGIREARGAMKTVTSPAAAMRRGVAEKVDGIITGALGGAAAANLLDADPTTGALLGGVAGLGAAAVGESRTARTLRTVNTIKAGGPIFENRIIREQMKDGLRPFTDDEVAALYAQMQTDITQFRIAKEGRGYFLNTPHGQALGALQSYTLNQAEFVGGRLQSFIETANRAIKGEPVQVDFRVFRYASYMMAVGSIYGALLGGSHDGENDPDYWVSRLGFGVMPLLHWNDIGRKWEVLPPTDLFKGPLIGDITRVANSYFKLWQDESANASFMDTSDKLTEALFPGAKNINKARAASEGKTAIRYLSEGAQESATPRAPQWKGVGR